MVVATGWFGFRRESDTRRLRGGGFGYCFVLVVCVLTPACGRVGFEALASYDEADDANPSPEGPNAAPSPANESTPPAPPTSGNDDADAGADSSEGNGGASGSGSGGTSVAGSTASAGGSSGAARGGSGGTGLAGASAAGAVSSTDGGAGAGSSGGGSSAAGASSAGGGSGAGGASSAGGGSGAGGASSASGGGGASAGSGSTDPCAPTNGGVEICDGLDNDCNGGVDENGCPSTCSGVAYAGDGYMVCDSMIPWDEAVATCATENMLLATAKTAEKNQVLVDLMYPADGSQDLSFGWLGLSRADSSSPFYWTDGTVLEGYANWEGGNPSGAGVANCVQMNSAGEWFASRCDFVKRFVCEPA